MESGIGLESKNTRGWQLWLGALIAVAAFAFGAYGLWQYEMEHGGHPDPLSVFYHTLQLFILHAPHLEFATPWQLHVGRLLAAGLVFAAAGKALLIVFRSELLLLRLWLPWRRGHVVVCGLGKLGMRLALGGRRRKKFVVAIEKDPQPNVLEQARSSGILVLNGDARDPATLHQARFERAQYLIAACKEDDANVAIAALAGGFARSGKAPPAGNEGSLSCRLLVKDSKLRAVLNKRELFPNTGKDYRVNLSDLDLESTAARQALRLYPLDFQHIGEDDDVAVHLVIIGFGQMGQSLALQAARIGHFANEVGKHQKRLRITVVDRDATAWNAFLSDYKNIDKACEVTFAEYDLDNARFVEAMAAYCPQVTAVPANENTAKDPAKKTTGKITTNSDPSAASKDTSLVTIAVCLDEDDRTGLRLGLELSQKVSERPAQILIYQKSRHGFASLFPAEGRGSKLNQRVHAFGMEEDVYSWNVLLHESEDQIARAIHEDYQKHEAQRKALEEAQNEGQNEVQEEVQKQETEPEEWNNLDEGMKNSNRQAADHIPIKLRALGLHDSPVDKNSALIKEFDKKQRELLAKMEHARWSAERYVAGWKFGEVKNVSLRISDCLIPWDQLTDGARQKDLDQIDALPAILEEAKRGIYR